MYEKLKKDVEQSKVSIFKHHFFEINRLKNVDNEKEIKINLKSYAKQALFDKHFRIIEKNQRNLHVICNHCRSNLYGTLRNQNFRRHLEVIFTQIRIYRIYCIILIRIYIDILLKFTPFMFSVGTC